MNPQGNTMQPPAPLARKAERVLMTIAAAYNVIMASITLFMFTSWFKGQAYDLLEHNGLLKTDYSAVDNASTVVGIYALLVLIIGIVSFIMSMRCLAPGTTSRWVIIWLAIVVVFSLGTMDLIGLALYSITGYYAKKLIYYKNIISQTSEVIEEYPFPIVRLADLYLMYAEALNEATDNGEFVPTEVYTNIDIVRERSGLEGVIDSWKKYSTNPNKPSTKEGMREIIRRERQIELALEGIRYHDLRRWKLAKSTYNNTFVRGWSIDQENTEDYYVVRNIAQKKYSQKDYLWPVKYDDIIKNPNLKQNPGW